MAWEPLASDIDASLAFGLENQSSEHQKNWRKKHLYRVLGKLHRIPSAIFGMFPMVHLCLEEAVAFLFEITPRKTSPTRNHPSRLDGFMVHYTHHDMPTDAHYDATMSHFPEIPTCIRAKPACTRRQRSSCDVTTWVDTPANNTRLTK